MNCNTQNNNTHLDNYSFNNECENQLDNSKRRYFTKLNKLYENSISDISNNLNSKEKSFVQIPIDNNDDKISIYSTAVTFSVTEINIFRILGEKLTELLRKDISLVEEYFPPENEITKEAYVILGCKTIPKSDFEFYLNRIKKYSNFEDAIYLAATVLVRRCFNKLGGFDPRLLHKCFLGCLALVSKLYAECDMLTLEYQAKIYGIPLPHLARIELFVMFTLLDSRLVISLNEWMLIREKLIGNGFVTYMLNMNQNIHNKISNNIKKNF